VLGGARHAPVRTYRWLVHDHAGSPGAPEPTDPLLPRRSTGRRALRYALVSGVVGVLVVLISLIVSVETGGTQWSASNVSWIIFGGATGAVFGPLFALARDDGSDEEAFRAQTPVHGEADTSLEGAQAQDRQARVRARGGDEL
jgi:hypothetical protein